MPCYIQRLTFSPYNKEECLHISNATQLTSPRQLQLDYFKVLDFQLIDTNYFSSPLRVKYTLMDLKSAQQRG